MNNFITLTCAYNGDPIILNVKSITYMRPDENHHTRIRFSSAFNTLNSCSLAGITVKETLEQIQYKMYHKHYINYDK